MRFIRDYKIDEQRKKEIHEIRFGAPKKRIMKLITDINAGQPELPLCDYDEEHLLVFDIIWAGKYQIYSDLYYPIEEKKVVNRKNPNDSRIAELNQHMEEQKEILTGQKDCICEKFPHAGQN